MTSGRFPINDDSDCTTTNSNASTELTETTATTTNTDNQNDTNVLVGGTAEHIRKFVFTSISNNSENLNNIQIDDNKDTNNETAADVVVEKLEVKIPELLHGGYSFYTWPSAPVLAWFLWERRQALVGKTILELGAGTALPGILLAKCGAKVILSDNLLAPKALSHIRRSCHVNDLKPGQDIQVIGLSWGLILNSVFHIDALDLIIASDCFYDPSVFEDIIVTVSFLLERNPGAKFLFTYQERSADWSLEALLKKWKLAATQINIDDIGKYSGIDIYELMGGHTIHLIQITRDI